MTSKKTKKPQQSHKHYFLLPSFMMRFAVVMLMFLAGYMLFPEVPTEMPIHWDFAGHPDNWADKIWAIWLIPGLSLAMIVFFPLLARIDPKHKNYEKFRDVWEVIQTVIIFFFAYIYAVQFYMIFYPENGDMMGKFMSGGIGVLFIVLGAVMGKIRQNYFVGLKTPWTLDDPKVWKKSHRFTGWVFMAAGLVFLINGWLQLYMQTVFIATVILMILLPVVYSYFVSKSF